MPQTWKTKDQEQVTCSQCGSEYAVLARRFPLRDEDAYNCEVCGNRLRSWRGTTAYEFTLIRRGPV